MDLNQYKDILSMAVNKEIEAYEFYKAASEKVGDESLKSVFADLAKEELRHKVLLEGYLKNEGKKLKFDETKDYKVSETVEEKPLSTDMKFVDAIALAMKKEEEAMNMYNQFADISIDEVQKDTFLELSKMELGHKARLEEIYTNAAYVEVW
ncbi:rubrerythrin [Peptoclostridium acidaminophilum DSM 3953]|uniref:Rubrerythrin n=1 Tax=Peptoclostridium acidaminophilum DSM 3953 TaxID=1286171 RepID=W8TD34_PEPAC|nr:ferritin family protein [Peptoclostridium acidaminophilum]AHM55718.1 rubrerythrin [Peptoclostridium acidaminophilum DSM 3953]